MARNAEPTLVYEASARADAAFRGEVDADMGRHRIRLRRITLYWNVWIKSVPNTVNYLLFKLFAGWQVL
jgi:hypothetical protein